MVAVFGILLVLIALVAFGPALIAVVSQTVAEAFGCQVDLNRVIPCEIGGKDYGQTFYDLGFSIWYSYLSLPLGARALSAIWVVAASSPFILRGRREDGGPGPSPAMIAGRDPFCAARTIAIAVCPRRRSPSPIPPGSLRQGIGCDLNEVAEHPCTILGVNVGPLLATAWGPVHLVHLAHRDGRTPRAPRAPHRLHRAHSEARRAKVDATGAKA